ncbi:MAG: tRNA 2-thiouridine(34) synthase MnmA [Candidatus Wildermuthbacteria bacterium]|nr:tRNA 2-thiouridine(34) synthase MnmA [Candidatus Wildermuthbacteria bacterium]
MAEKKKKKQTVFVGLSGGVDSSVCAALLKKAGFSVTGIYMKCWTEGASCTTQEDERSARIAADHLGIPFFAWNFLDEYRKRVVEYMLEGYAKGITPNPDMMCNKEIKFGLFFEKAMSLGADFVATGHYARTEKRNGKTVLLKGVDPEKDQSYFLSFIAPAVLDRVLFPVGKFTKTQVRDHARKICLPNAERKDSQGICFVGKVSIGDFLREYIPAKEGNIVDAKGNILGKHDGSYYYTIGQRDGLGLAGGPYYVVKKDMRANTVTVSKDEKDILEDTITLKEMNWFSRPEQSSAKMTAKFRYRQEDAPVSVEILDKDSCVIKADQPQRAVTPGQFAVLYKEDEVMGAGVIV